MFTSAPDLLPVPRASELLPMWASAVSSGCWKFPTLSGSHCAFVYVEAGRAEVHTDDGQFQLGSRDLLVAAGGSAWRRIVVESGAKVIVGQLERSCAGTAIYRLASEGVVVTTVGELTANLVAHVLRGLAFHSASRRADVSARAASHISGLISLSIAEHRAGRGSAVGTCLLDEAKAFVELHLSEPDLGQEKVARALRVSTRTLARAFQQDGGTVASWIRDCRLERCRAELEDESMTYLPVSQVGARWGLPDPSHFSHSFRARFGVSPRAVRDASRVTRLQISA